MLLSLHVMPQPATITTLISLLFSVLACRFLFFWFLCFYPQHHVANQIKSFSFTWLLRLFLFFFNAAQFVTALSICLCLPLSFSLSASFLIFFSLLFAMLAGPNLPADISIPWHSANWQHCRREKREERERGERERMKEN